MTQIAKLTASDGAAYDRFGCYVAISGDTAVIGAYEDDMGSNTDQGSVYLFVKPESGWADMTQTAKLTASDGAAGDYFGISVGISSDRVVVGARYNDIGSNADQGSAYIFIKPAEGWTNMTQSAKLTASDGAAQDRFGNSAVIDGDTVVVGAYLNDIGSNADQGSAYVFTMYVNTTTSTTVEPSTTTSTIESTTTTSESSSTTTSVEPASTTTTTIPGRNLHSGIVPPQAQQADQQRHAVAGFYYPGR